MYRFYHNWNYLADHNLAVAINLLRIWSLNNNHITANQIIDIVLHLVYNVNVKHRMVFLTDV